MSLSGSASLTDQIKTAVLSARKNTDLEPVCICEGLVPEMEQFLSEQGVEIHYMTVPFVRRMAAAVAGKEGFSLAMANGTYLKLYVPLIETRDELVIYTDLDVMFQHHPILPPWEIRYLGATPEAQIENLNYFNCGVMIYNVANMRKILPDLFEFIEIRMRHAIFCAYEQGDLNGFLWMRWTHINNGNNWKPYWGANPNAPIIHFHGPKIRDYLRFIGQISGEVDVSIRHFIEADPSNYAFYAERLKEFDVDKVLSS